MQQARHRDVKIVDEFEAPARMGSRTEFVMADCAELRCLSNFSSLRGASSSQALVEQVHALGYRPLPPDRQMFFRGHRPGSYTGERIGA